MITAADTVGRCGHKYLRHKGFMFSEVEFDVEAELAKILREEIWREITAETGETQQDLDNKVIGKIRKIVESKDSL